MLHASLTKLCCPSQAEANGEHEQSAEEQLDEEKEQSAKGAGASIDSQFEDELDKEQSSKRAWASIDSQRDEHEQSSKRCRPIDSQLDGHDESDSVIELPDGEPLYVNSDIVLDHADTGFNVFMLQLSENQIWTRTPS